MLPLNTGARQAVLSVEREHAVMNIDRLYNEAVHLLAMRNATVFDPYKLAELPDIKFASDLFDVPELYLAQQVLATASRALDAA